MNLVTFIWFCLATIGLTNILVHGKIMDEIKVRGKSLREWLESKHFTRELFSCYECTGFWAGMICGCFFLPFGPALLLLPVCGFTGSMLGKTYTDIMFYLESKVEFTVGDDNAEETTGN